MLALLGGVVSCGVNSNIMLKQEKGVVANTEDIPMKPREDYRIVADDKFTFNLFTNDGYDLIDSKASPTANTNSGAAVEYTVRADGNVDLPIVGEVQVLGMTLEECEDTLQSLYATDFQDPYVNVKMKLTNQRVIVFPGGGSDAQVVPLTNTNVTLMEAIALAGGIADRGKADNIKLMRLENGVRKVYLIDLSTIDGLKYTDLIVQSNDYIYIEPNPDLGKEVAEKIIPITSILTTVVILISYLSTL